MGEEKISWWETEENEKEVICELARIEQQCLQEAIDELIPKNMTIQYRRELYKLLPPDFHSVEVGVASGLFTADILRMGSAKHYAVDSWTELPQRGDGGFPQSWHNENLESTLRLIEPYKDKVVILRGLSDHMSHQIPDESVDFIHLDGDHSYSGVKRDIEFYWPKLKPGGVFSGHDFENEAYGVKGAVLEFAYNNKLEVIPIPEDQPCDAGFYIIKPFNFRA